MKKSLLYTKKEDKTIYESIIEADYNVTKGSQIASSKLVNRTPKSVEMRWHNTLKNKADYTVKPYNSSFTKEEDNIIIQTLKDYPTNLKAGFEQVSLKLPKRNPKVIMHRWYNTLRKDPTNHVITCGSKKGFTQNVKNVKRDKEGNMPNQGLKHYMYIMKELLELSSTERQTIINFFQLTNS